MQKNFEIEQGVPEICPWGQVSPGASVWGANVAQSLGVLTQNFCVRIKRNGTLYGLMD